MKIHLKVTIAAAAVLLLGAALILPAQMMGRGMGMGGGMMGAGMMGGAWDYIPPGDVKPLTIGEAAEQVEQYLENWGNPELELAEVMEFSNHFYAEVEEASTGIHAFELLVNKRTGQIFSEPGPNMMWNLKYGHMGGGMMGGRNYRRQDPAAPARVKPEQAIKNAQKYLDALYPGLKADPKVDRFYGYYTIHTMKDGKVYGMLGVNGHTGDVWYHVWHGRYLGMKDMEEMEGMKKD
jgi:hypothetical protein